MANLTRLVGANIREIRRSQGITLEDLVGRLAEQGYPITLSALSRLERGERRIDVDHLVAIAGALGVSIEDDLLHDPNRVNLADWLYLASEWGAAVFAVNAAHERLEAVQAELERIRPMAFEAAGDDYRLEVLEFYAVLDHGPDAKGYDTYAGAWARVHHRRTQPSIDQEGDDGKR